MSWLPAWATGRLRALVRGELDVNYPVNLSWLPSLSARARLYGGALRGVRLYGGEGAFAGYGGA